MKDEARFRDWWTRVSPGVRRSIVSIVGTESIDILQDVSLMAIQRFGDFRDYEAFKTWCYIRARWLALDELSRRGLFVDTDAPIENAPASSADPRVDELRKMILDLPTQQQRVTLDKIQGFTSEEIATRNSIAVGTVRSTWRHAKQNLIEMMKHD